MTVLDVTVVLATVSLFAIANLLLPMAFGAREEKLVPVRIRDRDTH